ncbi:MAG: glutamate dehydrogenase, partial [Mycobacterium sp.]|nr:glutamate dehydrogenase [Mycobacterium sp.]
MTVNPGSGQDFDGSANTTVLRQDANTRLARAYLQTYQGPHGDAPAADSAITAPVDQSIAGRLVSPALLAAHGRLGRQRRLGETKVAVYGADDAAGFGPALQLVTDQSGMLMDSVTVLLHRLGVAYSAIMNPTFRVRRDTSGQLVEMRPAADPAAPRDGIDETWIHVALSPSVDGRSLIEAARLLPNVLADARQVAVDSAALNATLVGLANALDADRAGLFPSYDRRDVAALLRWLADGHFVLLGYQRCAVRDGEATADPASRLGVLRLRTDAFPQLTGPDDLLVLAQATMPSFLRYGAYPYIVVVRETFGGQGQAV